MRSLILAACAFAGLTGAAFAMPALPLQAQAPIVQVQLQCSPQSCIDPRTGIYTQSTCDRYGCRQSSGPVGRVGGPQPGYGGGYDDDRPRRRRYDDNPYAGQTYDRGGYGGGRSGYGGGGGFDCNASRCIAPDGRVWESTCDRRGCRPLRPARGY
ncbi:hypothetical protein LJR090_003568 [Bosea sp. LjRoot90]|uniref:hypothetical protein n=1 Tax=Bosea sp. LjRoot90 TaxID=3342342 RepID=UPI003ECD64CF